MKSRTFIEIVSLLLVFLFVYTAVSKLLDLQKFTIQVGQSPLLTEWAPFIAWLIPLLELGVSLLLVIPALRVYGLLASFGLMVMFTGYIISILHFSEHIPCACGGVIQRLGWTGHLIFNLVFVLLAGTGFFLHTRERYRVV